MKSARQPEGVCQAKIKLPDGKKVHKTFSVLKFGRTTGCAWRLREWARLRKTEGTKYNAAPIEFSGHVLRTPRSGIERMPLLR